MKICKAYLYMNTLNIYNGEYTIYIYHNVYKFGIIQYFYNTKISEFRGGKHSISYYVGVRETIAQISNNVFKNRLCHILGK